MSSVSDLFRAWLLNQLGLTAANSASQSTSDLENLLYTQTGVASNRRYTSGRYYAPELYITLSTLTPTLGTVYFVPFIVGVQASFAKICAEVTTLGSSSNTVQLGIYSSDSGGLPSTLVVDGGTNDTTAGINLHELTISASLQPGLYWLALVSNTGTSAVFRAYANNVSSPYISYTANPGSAISTCYIQTGQTSGLPATATPVVSGASTPPPRIFLKAA